MTAPLSNLTAIWNDGASILNAIKMNVTNTASAAGSMLFDLQIAGVSKFSVDKNGVATRIGVTDGSSAAAGKVGEVIQSVLPLASATSASASTWTSITSISLTAGEWEITAHGVLQCGTFVAAFQFNTAISTANNGIGAGETEPPQLLRNNVFTVSYYESKVGPMIVKLTTTTTYYLNMYHNGTASTVTWCGSIMARRVR